MSGTYFGGRSLALLVFAFMSFACDSADETESSSTRDTQLEVELQVPPRDALGDPAGFSLVVRNAGSLSTSFEIAGITENGFAGTVDFTVRDSGDREVWGYPRPDEKNGALLGARTGVGLAPGEELTIFSGEWDGLDNEEQPIPPGEYRVTAVLRAWGDDGQEFTITSETKEIEVS